MLSNARTAQPDAEWTADRIEILIWEQQRLAWYRTASPKKERRPLSSCSYMLARALYPLTDDDLQFAEYEICVFRIAHQAYQRIVHLHYTLFHKAFINIILIMKMETNFIKRINIHHNVYQPAMPAIIIK